VEHTAVSIGIRILEAVFAFGIVGSAIVVLIAGIQDIAEIFKPEREEQQTTE